MKLKDLENSNKLKRFEEITKGWSTDKKYVIENDVKQTFLMRVATIEQFSHKQGEFEKISELYSSGLPIPKPLDFANDEEKVYSLFTWLEGEDAEIIVPTLTAARQYQLGVEAGGLLKKIHSIAAPAEIEEWETKFSRKIDRNISNYQKCPLKYENGNVILHYIEANRHLIKGRTSVFQHGDYHTGNMILSAEQQLGIIDFNRWDYGDPWEEFNRIDFTAELSPQFAAGQIDGYFDNQPPEEFFKLLALYIGVNLLNALPWALAYSDEEVAVMQQKTVAVLDWFDDMQNVIPKWYRLKTT